MSFARAENRLTQGDTNPRWDQVDWEENLTRLEKKQTKGKQARVAPLYGELRGRLEIAYTGRGESEFILSWKREGISEAKTAWNKACQRAKRPSRRTEGFRSRWDKVERCSKR